MDNSITIALIAVGTALVSSVPGVLAYFNQKRLSASDATQKITEAAVRLVDPLQNQIDSQQARIETLEKENVRLREKIAILSKKNEYITELEMSKERLEEHIALLSAKLDIQGRMIQTLINAMRGFIHAPTQDQCEAMEKLLDDMEKQVEQSIRTNE
jgi:TolA-binding protein